MPRKKIGDSAPPHFKSKFKGPHRQSTEKQSAGRMPRKKNRGSGPPHFKLKFQGPRRQSTEQQSAGHCFHVVLMRSQCHTAAAEGAKLSKMHPPRPQNRPLKTSRIDEKSLPNCLQNQHRQINQQISKIQPLRTLKTVLPLKGEHNFHKIEVIRKSAKKTSRKGAKKCPQINITNHVREPWEMQAENMCSNLRQIT